MNVQVRQFVEELFASNQLNRLPENYGGGRIFDTPIIGVSRGDDPIFLKYKEVVGQEHLTPAEMWVQSGLPRDKNPAARLRIISIVFPYVNRIREESKNEKDMPAEIYCIGRNFANAFMDDVLKGIVSFFQGQEFQATAGILSKAFQIIVKEDPFRIYSVWSERHIAFTAGLGTFSLHEGLITEVGCNVRLASVITDAPLEVTPRSNDEPYANCLHYAKEKCSKCAQRCPGAAISEKGHDKAKCRVYIKKIREEMTGRLRSILKPHHRVIEGREEVSYPAGCAFCQFNVPCMERNPMRSRSKSS